MTDQEKIDYQNRILRYGFGLVVVFFLGGGVVGLFGYLLYDSFEDYSYAGPTQADAATILLMMLGGLFVVWVVGLNHYQTRLGVTISKIRVRYKCTECHGTVDMLKIEEIEGQSRPYCSDCKRTMQRWTEL